MRSSVIVPHFQMTTKYKVTTVRMEYTSHINIGTLPRDGPSACIWTHRSGSYHGDRTRKIWGRGTGETCDAFATFSVGWLLLCQHCSNQLSCYDVGLGLYWGCSFEG